jgi:hypothetical protein
MDRIYEHITTRRLHLWIEEFVWGLRVQSPEAFGIPWRKQGNNIKNNLIIIYKDRNWAEISKNTDHCQVIVNTAVKFQVQGKYETP